MSTENLLNPGFIGQELINHLQREFAQQGGLAKAFKVAAAHPSWSPVTVTYISDNGNYADLARAEIEKRLKNIDTILATVGDTAPTGTIYHDIPSMDWRAGAVDLAQLARDTVLGPGNVIFVNCAPRLAQRGVQGNNKGENIYIGMLKNGTIISGVSEHSFAFFRDLVKSGELEIFPANVQIEGSQFRSRDYFPWFAKILAHNAAQQADSWKADLGVDERREFLRQFNFVDTKHKLSAEHIPDLKAEPCVARVDTHGNLKLSLTLSDAIDRGWVSAEGPGKNGKPILHGRPLRVTVGREAFDAQIVTSMFDTKNGNKGIAQGSTGDWPDAVQEYPRFLELAIIGNSLREHLGITHEQLRDGVEVFIQIAPDAEQDNEPGVSAAPALAQA